MKAYRLKIYDPVIQQNINFGQFETYKEAEQYAANLKRKVTITPDK